MLFLDDTQPLPIIPGALARQHLAHHRLDTPFRAAARLQQSLWRARQPAPDGLPFDPDRVAHLTGRLAAKLAKSPLCESRNFLDPDVLIETARDVVYAERGALMDEARLANNPLSSSALTYNLGAFLKLHREVGHRFVEELFPGYAGQIGLILFEHSPARGDPALTADGTAYDLAFYLRRLDGSRTFIGMEFKYTEAMAEPEAEHRARYDELAASSGLYRNPAAPALRKAPIQQLFREHLLAQAMVDAGLVDDALFVLVAPELNMDVQRAAACYRTFLAHEPGKVPFLNVGLRRAIEAVRTAGAPDYAEKLHDRYGSFVEVRRAVAEFMENRE
jgi:hypothetical protein